MKFEELDSVKTLRDFPNDGIKKGEIGTVVATFTKPNEAYEIEFCSDTGETKAMFAILPDDLELLLFDNPFSINKLKYASGK